MWLTLARYESNDCLGHGERGPLREHFEDAVFFSVLELVFQPGPEAVRESIGDNAADLVAQLVCDRTPDDRVDLA